jgi:hypothetical protein
VSDCILFCRSVRRVCVYLSHCCSVVDDCDLSLNHLFSPLSLRRHRRQHPQHILYLHSSPFAVPRMYSVSMTSHVCCDSKLLSAFKSSQACRPPRRASSVTLATPTALDPILHFCPASVSQCDLTQIQTHLFRQLLSLHLSHYGLFESLPLTPWRAYSQQKPAVEKGTKDALVATHYYHRIP